MQPSGDRLVGLLATPARLRVAAAVVLGAATPSEVSAATGLSEAQVAAGLTKLIRGGLITVHEGQFALDADVFARAARTAATKAEPVDYGVSDPKVAAVLHAFLVDGRLTSIPASGRKRSIVLEYLVAAFEPGQRYPEAAVNVILASFHSDTAMLRRCLVDEGLLDREHGVYWRIGGWVDVL